MDEERFSLKDHLFNEQQVKKIAKEIKAVYSDFEHTKFSKKIINEFPRLELMERVYWIRDCLREFLPDDYRAAVKILLESLPPPCDPALSDDDFGSFIYSPYSYFVAEYGCDKKNLLVSFRALRHMTMRFSVEGPIRFFINEFPRETMAELQKWTHDSHYHVRRLASEGTRPNLPWAKKINISHEEPVDILNSLYADKTRFVTRSVANHMNDISKIDPDLVIKMLKVWRKIGGQNSKELDYMTRHSLRTLVKDGNTDALELLGFSSKEIRASKPKILTPKVKIGESLEFTFSVTSTGEKAQDLMIDYVLYFNKANGKLAPKTFKISKTKIKPGETLHLKKKQPLKKMTTRKLHPGVHKIELQINGQKFGKHSFTLAK